MDYKKAYNNILEYLIKEHEGYEIELAKIEADTKIPNRGLARNLIRIGARANMAAEIISMMRKEIEE